MDLPFDLAQGGELVEPFSARPVEFRHADQPKAGFHRASASDFEFSRISYPVLTEINKDQQREMRS